MYGSYSSYSRSYNGPTTTPLDISPSRLSTRGGDASCAFPSWPRRSSLSSNSDDDDDYVRPTSFLSDEDLFPTDEDVSDTRSVSSAGSPGASPPTQLQQPSEAELLQMQRERAEAQREAVRLLLSERERRRQAAKLRVRAAAGRKTSSPKNVAMTPIAE